MAFVWTNDLATGNAQIDTEHKKLIEAINNLLTACSTGQGRQQLEPVLDFLTEYTKTHFAHEEVLQMQSGYPDRVNHKQYHTAFVKVVEGLSARLKTEGPSIVLVGEINQRLCDWLINHIKREDIKVAQHIASQNK